MSVNPTDSAVLRNFLNERIERGKQASFELNNQIDTISFKDSIRLTKRFDGLASERMTSDLLENSGKESEIYLSRIKKWVWGYHVDVSERIEALNWYIGTVHSLNEALIKLDESSRYADKLIEKAEHLLDLRDSEIKRINEEHRAYIEQALNEKNELLRTIEDLKKQVDNVHNEYKNKIIKKLSPREIAKEAKEVVREPEVHVDSAEDVSKDTKIWVKPEIRDEDIIERSAEDEMEPEK